MLWQLLSSHDNGQSMDIHPLGYETCSVSCHRDMTTVRAWLFISKVWNMLCQLSSPHDNGQSMVIHPSDMKHAPSVVIVTWQRSEHGYLSLRYETCSVSCHRDMTTVRAWLFISKVWNMLRQLSSFHENGQSMVIHPLGIKHAPSVVIVIWQRSEHGYSSLKYETCFVSCHRLMTMVRAWLFIPKVWNMLRQLSSWHDNGQSMIIYLWGMKHAPSVVIVTWQRSEHGYSSLRYETCSVSCHRDMTTVRAWLFIPKVWNMLRQLSSCHDNAQSIVIHLLGMKHAPSVVNETWQQSEHGYLSLRYETCFVSCHRLMTTVRAWLFISKVWNMLRQLSSWHDSGQSMVIHL